MSASSMGSAVNATYFPIPDQQLHPQHPQAQFPHGEQQHQHHQQTATSPETRQQGVLKEQFVLCICHHNIIQLVYSIRY